MITPQQAASILQSLANASYTEICKLNEYADSGNDKFKRMLDIAINDAKDKEEVQRNLLNEKQDIIKLINTENDEIKKEMRYIKDVILPRVQYSEKNLVEKNEYLNNQVRKMKNSFLIIATLIIIGSGIFMFIKFTGIITKIISSIAGLGGLWGFISLIINLLKIDKK